MLRIHSPPQTPGARGDDPGRLAIPKDSLLAQKPCNRRAGLDRFEAPDCACPMELLSFAPDDAPDDAITDTHVRDPGIPAYRLLALVFGTDACRDTLDTDHRLTLEEWTELQRLIDAEEYSDPPPPRAPAIALTREARIEVYEQRATARVGLYHPDDLWRHGPDSLSVKGSRLRNGAAVEGAVTQTRRAA